MRGWKFPFGFEEWFTGMGSFDFRVRFASESYYYAQDDNAFFVVWIRELAF
jgi:hypothetical protein